MSSSEDEKEELIAISEDFVQSPQYKPPETSQVDFDGLLKQPLKLHEDLAKGCGGQLWPAGMVLAKYMLRRESSSLAGKSM